MGDIRSQRLSEKKETKSDNPMQLFTDREDPQEAFERKLSIIREYKNDASAVLCFYGIGGIGKTSFRNKLCHMINGDPDCPWILNGPIDCEYAVYDFGEENITNDARTVMSRLKEQLENKGCSFYLFNIAMLLYAKKAGIVFNDDKSASFILEKSPFASAVVSAIGTLPVVSWVSNAIQAMDQAAAGIKQLIDDKSRKKYKDELTQMHNMEASEILDNLKRYFVIDMQINMANSKKPLVIFLDTYEKYVDTLSSDTLKITDDYWLWKGEDSVLQAIPGILWVILGREKLSFEKGDDHWKCELPEKPLSELAPEEKEDLSYSNMEQHLLGDLSEKDAICYMKKAGIDDESLCHELYENITGGTPLYIYICVQQYKAVISSRKPVIEDFGRDISELVSRYLQNMPDYYKEMSYFLATLGSWTDELVYEIASRIESLKGFNKERYKDYVAHSFVIEKPDGVKYLHDVVKKAYLENAGEKIVYDVQVEYEKYLSKRIKEDSSADIADHVSAYIDNLMNMDPDYDMLYDSWELIRDGLDKIERLYDLSSCIKLCERFLNYVQEAHCKTPLERRVVAAMSYYLCAVGKIQEGVRTYTDYFNMESLLSVVEDKNTYRMYLDAASVLSCVGKPYDDQRERHEYIKKAYEGLSDLLGENDPETILALKQLARSFGDLGDTEKQKELSEKVYEKCQEVLGGYHPLTLSALNDLAFIHEKSGSSETAHELFLRLYEIRTELLGEDHPDTLSALNNLAGFYYQSGEIEKACEMFEALYEKSLSVSQLNTKMPSQSYMHNYAITCLDSGRYEKAKELFKKEYDVTIEMVGVDSDDSIRILENLADACFELREFNEARESLESAYDGYTQKYGCYNENALRIRGHLETVYHMLDMDDLTIGLYTKIYDRMKEEKGEDDPNTLLALDELARQYFQFGLYDIAKDLYAYLYEKCVSLYGEDDPKTMNVRKNLTVIKQRLQGNHSFPNE